MGGRRSTKEELMQLEAMTEEGLTIREIAQRLGRSEAGIRNLRYRKRMVKKAEDETKVLFQRRDELRNAVRILQGQKTLLTEELESLEKQKEKLETIVKSDKTLLQGVLAQALTNLKQHARARISSLGNLCNQLCVSEFARVHLLQVVHTR